MLNRKCVFLVLESWSARFRGNTQVSNFISGKDIKQLGNRCLKQLSQDNNLLLQNEATINRMDTPVSCSLVGKFAVAQHCSVSNRTKVLKSSPWRSVYRYVHLLVSFLRPIAEPNGCRLSESSDLTRRNYINIHLAFNPIFI